MVFGTGANCTDAGTAVPTPILKFTLDARGALLLLIIVWRISVFCWTVRLTVALAEAEADEELDDDAFEPELEVEGDEEVCVEPPLVLTSDWPLVRFGEFSTFELP
jgi:hypothetical protein